MLYLAKKNSSTNHRHHPSLQAFWTNPKFVSCNDISFCCVFGQKRPLVWISTPHHPTLPTSLFSGVQFCLPSTCSIDWSPQATPGKTTVPELLLFQSLRYLFKLIFKSRMSKNTFFLVTYKMKPHKNSRKKQKFGNFNLLCKRKFPKL